MLKLVERILCHAKQAGHPLADKALLEIGDLIGQTLEFKANVSSNGTYFDIKSIGTCENPPHIILTLRNGLVGVAEENRWPTGQWSFEVRDYDYPEGCTNLDGLEQDEEGCYYWRQK